MVERYKNYQQMMIWAHNRLDFVGLQRIEAEIIEAYKRSFISGPCYKSLIAAAKLYLDDCRQALKKEEKRNAAMAQGFDPLFTPKSSARPMAGMLPDREGD